MESSGGGQKGREGVGSVVRGGFKVWWEASLVYNTEVNGGGTANTFHSPTHEHIQGLPLFLVDRRAPESSNLCHPKVYLYVTNKGSVLWQFGGFSSPQFIKKRGSPSCTYTLTTSIESF